MNDQAVVCAPADVAFRRLPKDESFLKLSEFYGLDVEVLRTEKKVHVNYRIEEEDDDGNTNASSLAKNLCFDGLHFVLPEFCRVVSILATIPETSCSSEYSFSGQSRMKRICAQQCDRKD